MANVILNNINKIYKGDVHAVKECSLEINDNELIVLIGPSGCGKSTLLRMIAGLEDVTSGDIYIAGERVNDMPPKDRDVAMVFQNYALYPHMTVYDNMAFSLKTKKLDKDNIDRIVIETAKMLDIEHLLNRKPKSLSGGEKQRVAMGRAIVRTPKLFLMDEPLSNLDAKLRVKMRREISKLHDKLGTTIIYVTHDQVEAMTLGTRIAVFNKGELQQVDTPANIYNFPNNIFVAGFIGTPQMNFINVKVINKGNVKLLAGEYIIDLNEIQEEIVSKYSSMNKEMILGIRPEDIIVCQGDKFDIHSIEIQGAEKFAYIDLNGDEIIVKVSDEIVNGNISHVDIKFNIDKLHLFDPETKQAISLKKTSLQPT